MAATGFAYSHLFAKDLPPAAPRWTGFPKYNFIGGHNDPRAGPGRGFGSCGRRRCCGATGPTWRSTTRTGRRVSVAIRDFVVDKVARRAASNARPTRC